MVGVGEPMPQLPQLRPAYERIYENQADKV